MRAYSRALFVVLACIGIGSSASAQTPSTSSAAGGTANEPRKHKFDPYQSPLTTVMQSRLWADVPEARGFVRETRPDAKTLKYTPLQSQVGPDPVRPKPRDAANIMALQAEMEESLAHNEARAGHGKGKARRAKAEPASN